MDWLNAGLLLAALLGMSYLVGWWAMDVLFRDYW